MSFLRIAPLGALILLLAPSAIAQEPVPGGDKKEPEKKKAPVDPRAAVLAAVKTLEAREDIVFKVRISHDEGNAGGFGAGIRVMGTGMDQGKSPTGTVEAWRGKDGAIVLVSEKKLPGFAVYLKDDTTIEQTVVQDDKISLARIKSELGAFLELDRLMLWMKKAKWTREAADELTGETTYSGEISKRLVKSSGGGVMAMALGKAKVLRIGARLTMDKDGALKETRFRVVRTDPMARMIRIVQRQGGPGANPFAPPPGQDDDDDDKEGGSSTYVLTIGKRPSKHAEVFKRKVEGMLGQLEEDE